MKKRFAAVLAATAVLGVTTAFAANPFSDVEPSHWAYQAVAQLAGQGVVDGYPDGTFKGERNITRYEMAQMVARAMAKQDRVDAEQNAMINRLADEFSGELNTLGVRVSNLENKIGNVKVGGDFRVRFVAADKSYIKDAWDYRGRLTFDGMVNDSTMVNVRVATESEFGEANNGVKVEAASVTHKFGDMVSLTAGRSDLFIGEGLIYDGSVDGVVGQWMNDSLTLTGGYGHISDFNYSKPASFAQVMAYVGDKTGLAAYYLKANVGKTNEVYGFSANTMLADFWVGGEWATQKDVKGSDAWVAGVGYGSYDQAQKGSWDVKLQYFKFEDQAPAVATTWNVTEARDYKGWLATVDYALADNVGLNVYYNFEGKSIDGKTKISDVYRVELNYQF